MKGTKLGIAIIGAGRISDLHAAGYLKDDRCKITAVCDLNSEAAHRRAAVWGVDESRVTSDYRRVLEAKDIDLVEILVPHNFHYPIAVEALEAGKAVSLQKPMALSMTEANGLVAAVKRTGVFFRVIENFLYYDPIKRAKELVDAGEIGDVLSIRLKSHSGYSQTEWYVSPAETKWRLDPEVCGGGPAVFDDGWHKFAIAWSFMGLASDVFAWIGATETDLGGVLDCPSIVSMRWSDGRVGSFEAVHSPELELGTNQYPQDDRVEISGTRGVIWVTRGHGWMLDVPPVVLYRDRRTSGFADLKVGWETSFEAATRDLVDGYFNGVAPLLTAEQGREVLQMALAAQISAREQRAVTVSELK